MFLFRKKQFTVKEKSTTNRLLSNNELWADGNVWLSGMQPHSNLLEKWITLGVRGRVWGKDTVYTHTQTPYINSATLPCLWSDLDETSLWWREQQLTVILCGERPVRFTPALPSTLHHTPLPLPVSLSVLTNPLRWDQQNRESQTLVHKITTEVYYELL